MSCIEFTICPINLAPFVQVISCYESLSLQILLFALAPVMIAHRHQLGVLWDTIQGEIQGEARGFQHLSG